MKDDRLCEVVCDGQSSIGHDGSFGTRVSLLEVLARLEEDADVGLRDRGIASKSACERVTWAEQIVWPHRRVVGASNRSLQQGHLNMVKTSFGANGFEVAGSCGGSSIGAR